jgi:hypothetical protein
MPAFAGMTWMGSGPELTALKVFADGDCGALLPTPAGAKVFCFFFSKKKRFS